MNTIQYKCPNCGAELTFQPDTQDFACHFCNCNFSESEIQTRYARMEQEAEQSADQNTKTAADTSDFEDGARLYHCPNCGAQIIADEETSATFCYYCHSPVMLSGRLSGEYRPAYVIPFAISREKVTEQFHQWCKKRWFLPKELRSEKQLENFSGIYVPFWLTNCRADAAISGNGDRVRSWREGDYRVTETQHFRIEREAEIPFRGIPMDGAKKIDDSLMNAIEPFSYEKMKSFQMHYLSGFLAQKYDESYDEVFPRIQQRIQQSCISLLRADVKGYTKCQITSTQVNLYEVQHDYALLPVWFLHYAYKGKNYDFAINGQTGKQAGTPPFSWGRAALFSGAVTMVVTLLLALICFFGGAA